MPLSADTPKNNIVSSAQNCEVRTKFQGSSANDMQVNVCKIEKCLHFYIKQSDTEILQMTLKQNNTHFTSSEKR